MSRNSVPNPSAGEKTTRNSVPRNKSRSISSEFPSEVRKSRLSSTPLQVLEKRRHEKEAHGEIETQHPGYLGCQEPY
jgi:hypothetical protein